MHADFSYGEQILANGFNVQVLSNVMKWEIFNSTFTTANQQAQWINNRFVGVAAQQMLAYSDLARTGTTGNLTLA